jgi:hypothetical protein
MPKLNPVGILVASVLFYLVGFLWYGFLFMDAWMAAEGLVADDAAGQSPIYMLGGFLITVMQVVGLAIILKWRGVTGIAEAAKTALLLWALIALPFTMYAFLYLPAHNATLLMIDASHLLVGWLVAAFALAMVK